MTKLYLVPLVVLLANCGGSPGEQGPAGPAGTAGFTLKSNKRCVKTDTGSGLYLIFQYQILEFTSGDRFMNCSLDYSDSTYSQTMFFPAGTAKGDRAECIMVFDVDSASYGFWTFTTVGGTSKAVYSDTGSSKNNYTVTFSDVSDCP